MKDIFTHPEFWDCECIENYIHLKERAGDHCRNCGAYEDNQPDSIINEVYNFILETMSNTNRG